MITQCSHCNVSTGGQHEFNCPNYKGPTEFLGINVAPVNIAMTPAERCEKCEELTRDNAYLRDLSDCSMFDRLKQAERELKEAREQNKKFAAIKKHEYREEYEWYELKRERDEARELLDELGPEMNVVKLTAQENIELRARTDHAEGKLERVEAILECHSGLPGMNPGSSYEQNYKRLKSELGRTLADDGGGDD